MEPEEHESLQANRKMSGFPLSKGDISLFHIFNDLTYINANECL